MCGCVLADITSYHNNIQRGSSDQVDAACLVLENGTIWEENI